jgi:hypothetical protein
MECKGQCARTLPNAQVSRENPEIATNSTVGRIIVKAP